MEEIGHIVAQSTIKGTIVFRLVKGPRGSFRFPMEVFITGSIQSFVSCHAKSNNLQELTDSLEINQLTALKIEFHENSIDYCNWNKFTNEVGSNVTRRDVSQVIIHESRHLVVIKALT